LAIEFSILQDNQAIQIEIDGDVTADQVDQMRQRSVTLVEETGFKNFIVDLRNFGSLERGNTFAIFDIGNNFSDHQFTVWSNTAVLMPDDEKAREQIEFLHTVEVNRGRGVINYVKTKEEAFSWFELMSDRV